MPPDPEFLKKLKSDPNNDIERELLSNPPAPRLTGPADYCGDVAIPQSVTDALNEALAKNEFPLDPALVGFLEAEVAHYNNVPRASICAHPLIGIQGKTWERFPEIAAISTGFEYFP
jgi:hypothetical protein